MDTPSLLVRERILSEAARLFVSQGYDGISMREIASACSLSKAGIYYHFKDKQDLFLALLLDNLEQVSKLVADVRSAGGSARDQIEAFTRGLFEHLSANQRAVIRLANQEISKLSAEIREEFGIKYYALFIGPLQDIFAEGIQNGELRNLDSLACTWVLLGMLYPLFSSAGDTRPEAGSKALETALDIFFNGLSNS